MNEFLKNNHPSELDVQNNIEYQNIKINKIKLDNRYNANIWLEHIDKDLWQLKSEDPEDLQYMRIIYEADKSVYAVDPSGGPFLSLKTIVGFEEKYIIDEIFRNGFIFKLTRYEL